MMKRIVTNIALCALLAVTFASQAAKAEVGRESHIYVNNMSDAYAWVTVYHGSGHTGVLGAWCVKPRIYDRHGLQTSVYETFVEVSQDRCQGHILVSRDFRVKGIHASVMTAKGTRGHYELSGPVAVP
jgi:hypothetical protein